MKPICDSSIEAEETLEAVVAVLSNPYSCLYPKLFPYIKSIWLIALTSVLFGKSQIYNLFGMLSMLLIGTFQSMADTKEWDYVWLVSNSVAMWMVGFYYLYEMIKGENHFVKENLVKSRLWILLCFPLLLWYPVTFRDGVATWDFSLQTLVGSEAGTAFCYVSPTLLAILILFYPHVNRSLFGCLTLACSMFGIASISVFCYKRMWPLVCMHIPLLALSIYGYILYFRKEPIQIEETNKSKAD